MVLCPPVLGRFDFDVDCKYGLAIRYRLASSNYKAWVMVIIGHIWFLNALNISVKSEKCYKTMDKNTKHRFG